MSRKSFYAALSLLVLAAVLSVPWNDDAPVAAAADIQVSRLQFAQYLDELSEPEGYFDTDNFISNETSYLHVVPELRERVRPGNVYLGVGPDQNFSYIAHTQPALAIIADIRRQNMLQHLFYKALFDLSSSRIEFLAMLFSTDPPKPAADSRLPELLTAIRRSPRSEARYKTNLQAIRRRLVETYGLRLDSDDLRKIEYVHRTMYEEGLALRFSSIGRNNASNYPTFESLLLQTDRSGTLQGYLSSEELFQRMKRFHAENRLIPIVADFAGSRAFKAVAAFLRKNGLEVSTFYTSNVEYYLFGSGDWRAYVDNVRSLPVTKDSVFIRAYFTNAIGRHPMSMPGHRSMTLAQSLPGFLGEVAAGRIRSYVDLMGR